MPRLLDLPQAIKKEGAYRFLCNVWSQVTEDNVLTWAAALSYSWLLALFPFIIFLLTLLPYIPEQQKTQVLTSINDFIKQLPAESAGLLGGYVIETERVLREPRGGLTLIGLGLSLWTASGGMASTMTALDRCYDVEDDRPFYRQRPIAILLTMIAAVLMLLVVIILPIGGLAMNWLWNHSVEKLGYQLPSSLKIILDVARWVMGLFLLMVVLNVIYHYGSQIRRRYRFITPGAVFCVLAWVALGLGFRWYIDTIAQAGYSKTYGAVGGVIILLFLLYLAATILLMGAEINSEIDYTVYPVRRGELDLRPAERAIGRQRRELRKQKGEQGKASGEGQGQ